MLRFTVKMDIISHGSILDPSNAIQFREYFLQRLPNTPHIIPKPNMKSISHFKLQVPRKLISSITNKFPQSNSIGPMGTLVVHPPP
jgi:hypothetical protein